MTAEIKLRAWHKTEKIMGDVEVLTIGEGAFVKGVRPGNNTRHGDVTVLAPSHGRFCPLEDIELLRYTGLKDKNGAEIWEGAILLDNSFDEELSMDEKYYNIVGWNDRTARFEMVERICVGPVIAGSRTDTWESYDYGEDEFAKEIRESECEVVGDIYQNPELLK